MFLGLNGATLPTAHLEEALRAARDAGFIGYEPRVPTLERCEARGKREAALSAVTETELTWLPLNALEGLFSLDRSAIFSRAKAVFSLAAKFRVPQVVLVPGAARPIDSAARADLAWLKSLATQYHVTVLYEFIGFPSFAFPSLNQAHDLASASGVPLVLDTFHLAVSRTPPEEIARVPKTAIGLVHLSDAITEGKAVEELQDEDRVLPGEGGLPLADLMGAIYHTGYRGPVSVEVFHPRYAGQEQHRVAQEAYRLARDVLVRAGWQP